MKSIDTQIKISAPPSAVWAKLLDFPSHAEWDPFFERIEGNAVEDQYLRIKQRKPDGKGMEFAPRVLDVQQDRYFRWQGKFWFTFLFQGTHRFELIPEDGGNSTMLRHGEDFRGILLPILGSLLQETEQGFEAFNKALAKQVEAVAVK
jgi:hypothetical protein